MQAGLCCESGWLAGWLGRRSCSWVCTYWTVSIGYPASSTLPLLPRLKAGSPHRTTLRKVEQSSTQGPELADCWRYSVLLSAVLSGLFWKLTQTLFSPGRQYWKMPYSDDEMYGGNQVGGAISEILLLMQPIAVMVREGTSPPELSPWRGRGSTWMWRRTSGAGSLRSPRCRLTGERKEDNEWF